MTPGKDPKDWSGGFRSGKADAAKKCQSGHDAVEMQAPTDASDYDLGYVSGWNSFWRESYAHTCPKDRETGQWTTTHPNRQIRGSKSMKPEIKDVWGSWLYSVIQAVAVVGPIATAWVVSKIGQNTLHDLFAKGTDPEDAAEIVQTKIPQKSLSAQTKFYGSWEVQPDRAGGYTIVNKVSGDTLPGEKEPSPYRQALTVEQAQAIADKLNRPFRGKQGKTMATKTLLEDIHVALTRIYGRGDMLLGGRTINYQLATPAEARMIATDMSDHLMQWGLPATAHTQGANVVVRTIGGKSLKGKTKGKLRPFEEGAAAHNTGKKRNVNPYTPGTKEHADWKDGWISEAKAEQRQIQSEADYFSEQDARDRGKSLKGKTKGYGAGDPESERILNQIINSSQSGMEVLDFLGDGLTENQWDSLTYGRYKAWAASRNPADKKKLALVIARMKGITLNLKSLPQQTKAKQTGNSNPVQTLKQNLASMSPFEIQHVYENAADEDDASSTRQMIEAIVEAYEKNPHGFWDPSLAEKSLSAKTKASPKNRPPHSTPKGRSTSKKTSLPKIRSLWDLQKPEYAELAKIASSNLGGPSDNLQQAIRWLEMNAAETDEQGVVDEVNHCIPMLGGKSLPRTQTKASPPADDWANSRKVPGKDLQPGDVVLFDIGETKTVKRVDPSQRHGYQIITWSDGTRGGGNDTQIYNVVSGSKSMPITPLSTEITVAGLNAGLGKSANLLTIVTKGMQLLKHTDKPDSLTSFKTVMKTMGVKLNLDKAMVLAGELGLGRKSLTMQVKAIIMDDKRAKRELEKQIVKSTKAEMGFPVQRHSVDSWTVDGKGPLGLAEAVPAFVQAYNDAKGKALPVKTKGWVDAGKVTAGQLNPGDYVRGPGSMDVDKVTGVEDSGGDHVRVHLGWVTLNVNKNSIFYLQEKVKSLSQLQSVLPNRLKSMYTREEAESLARRAQQSLQAIGCAAEDPAYDDLSQSVYVSWVGHRVPGMTESSAYAETSKIASELNADVSDPNMMAWIVARIDQVIPTVAIPEGAVVEELAIEEKGLSYDSPQIVALNDKIRKLEEAGASYDDPRIVKLQEQIRALEVKSLTKTLEWSKGKYKSRGRSEPIYRAKDASGSYVIRREEPDVFTLWKNGEKIATKGRFGELAAMAESMTKSLPVRRKGLLDEVHNALTSIYGRGETLPGGSTIAYPVGSSTDATAIAADMSNQIRRWGLAATVAPAGRTVMVRVLGKSMPVLNSKDIDWSSWLHAVMNVVNIAYPIGMTALISYLSTSSIASVLKEYFREGDEPEEAAEKIQSKLPIKSLPNAETKSLPETSQETLVKETKSIDLTTGDKIILAKFPERFGEIKSIDSLGIASVRFEDTGKMEAYPMFQLQLADSTPEGQMASLNERIRRLGRSN